MQEYLVNDAFNKIWCNPYGDNPFVIKPERVTVGAGALNTAFLLGRDVSLPVKNKRTHVFQIGQYPPALMGLLENWPGWAAEKWFSFEQAMNQLPLYVNVYNEKGVNIPRSEAYFMYTREKGLIVALLVDPRLAVNYRTDNIYVRLYTNAYLMTASKTSAEPHISVKTFEINSTSMISAAVTYFNSQKAKAGNTEAFVNGQWIRVIDGKTVKVGDILEIIYESDVKRMVTWKIKNLKPFTSTLDDKMKYILHYAKSIKVEEIDFFDDIDVYIHYTTAQLGERGYYYHKNLKDAMRMLTHRDYSLTAEYVTYVLTNLFKDLGIVGNFLEADITIKIRRNDFDRKLIWDPNKNFDLYKLTDQRILMAMSGVDSLVPPWWAANLEESAYSLFMGATYKELTIENVQDAYGYNYISQVIADSPIKVTTANAVRQVVLPYGLAAYTSTAYELNAARSLVGVYIHDTRDDDYNLRNNETQYVEMLMGEGTNRPDVVFGETDLALTPDCDFRLYRCWKDFSQTPPMPMDNWEDITDLPDLYEVRNGKVVWTSPETGQYLMLRTNSKHLSYSFNAVPSHGNMVFQLAETVTRFGVTQERAMAVPGGDLQIWLNGRNLVQGIDYVVHFPWVCINNYAYFQQPVTNTNQRVHVRVTGFCSKDLELYPPKARGFVVNGALSNNKHFDIYEDKVMHISVAGGVYMKQDVTFYEDHPAWQPNSPLNGTPYQIENVVVPLRAFTEAGTYPLLDEAMAIDKVVEDYMELYYNKPTNEPISTATARWSLVSPFVSHIVGLCMSNEITFDPWVVLSDTEVRTICKPYEALLTYDPVYPGNQLPEQYVNIRPHRYSRTINVTRAQYRFLESVVRLYARDRVGLNNFVTFTV